MRSSSFWNIIGNVSRLVTLFFFLVALSSLQAQFLSAQGTWELISPKLGSGSRESIRATPSGLVLVVGQSGSILRSSDGGSSWQSMQTNTGAWLFGVAISAENRCLAVGQAGTILLSTDTGLTWQQRQSGTQAGLLAVQWLNATAAIAAGQSGTILKSTDGGLSWVSRSLGTSEQFESMHFVSDSVGLAVADIRILKTTDAGLSWQEKFREGGGGPGFGFVNVHFANPLNGFATKLGASTIYSSTDGGDSWRTIYNAQGSFKPTSVYCFDAQNVLVGGASGYGGLGGIRKSTNGGQSFEPCLSSNTTVLDIWLVSPLIGYASDQQGGSWKTTNGGNSWFNAVTSMLQGSLYDLSFWSESSGVIVGSSSAAYFTQDSGKTWNGRSTPIVFNNTFFFDSLNGIGTGWGQYENRIGSTADGGVTWSLPGNYPSITNGYYGIRFWNRQQGCLVGNYDFVAGHHGPVLRYSDDGGASWRDASYPPQRSTYSWINALSILENGLGYARYYDGQEAYIIKTSDYGHSWERVSVDTVPSSWVNMHFPTTTIGYMVGPGGMIMKTNDGAATWFALASGTTEYLQGVCFASPHFGVVAGDNGTILSTWDGGTTWHAQPRLTSQNLLKVLLFKSGQVIAIGGGGTIIRGQLTVKPPREEGNTIRVVSRQRPARNSLEQNYPNPFNGMTIIRFGLDDESPAVLSFYNTLGKKIDELASVSLPAGTYEFLWQPLNLASGVYFYVLRTSTLAFTKRLVYIK